MNTVMSLITYYSIVMNFDPALSLAVVRQETNFNNSVVGDAGEVGLFQIRPEYVGNYTKKELQNPEINIKVGIWLLKDAKKRCKHQRNLDWLVCYNAGVVGGSKYKYPSKSKYVIEVNKFYEEYKNAYANSLYQKRELACN